MALITQSVKNLIAGISQQPPILRHVEQLETQINGFSTEAGGLQKRPPTIHIAKLDKDVPLLSKVHVINRDEEERYMVAFTGTEIDVWSLQGYTRKVTYEGKARNYITTKNPKEDLRIVTVADYTFIVNRKITTKMIEEKENSTAWKNQGALINVRSGQYGRTYKIKINGYIVATYETPDGSSAEHVKNIDTNFIAGKLEESVKTNMTEAKVERGDSWLYIKTVTDINSVVVEDGFNNQAMKAFLHTAQNFTDLPATAPDGFTVLVKGQANSTDDDYYIKYSAKESVWKETNKPDLNNHIDKNTMPHSLVRTEDGTFVLRPIDWEPRQTGDEDSNPEPSFINYPINDIFFFRNRLGIVAGETVNLSKTGAFFDFWVESATGIIDTDPIDISVSHNRVSTLYHAIPFNQDLYLFSTQTQFILHADGVLSPKNAQIDQVTEFSSSNTVKPIGVGRNLYFTAERADYTTLREYFAVYDTSDSKDSSDITSHVPNFLKNHIYELISSTNENIIMALSDSAKDTLYLYKYLYTNNTKVQASWSEWKFNGEIIGGNFIDSTLYFLIKRGTNVFLEKLLINYDTKDYPEVEPYRCMVDRKKSIVLSKGTYDEETSTYTWTPTYGDKGITNEEYVLILSDGRVFRGTSEIVCKHVENLEGTKAILGTTYEFKIELSTIYVKKLDDQGTSTLPNYRLILRDIQLNYANTGEFTVNVHTIGKSTRSYKMTARVLGNINNKVGKHPLDTGIFKVPIQGTNTDITVEITNDSPLPVALIGYVYNALVSMRYHQI